jgi:hypothetical protein
MRMATIGALTWAKRNGIKAKCDDCGKEIAWAFGWNSKDKCRLVGSCTSGSDIYDVTFQSFIEFDGGPRGWLIHVGNKPWINRKQWLDAIQRSGLLSKMTLADIPAGWLDGKWVRPDRR